MAMNFDWKDFLLKHSLFVGLNQKEVERIVEQLLDDKVSNEKEFSEGKLIVKEGEPGDSVFLVGSGSVQVVLEGENGHDTPIAILRRGDFFGEMALLEKKPRAATVRAKESCTLLEINGQEFLKLLDEHRDVESKMLLKLSERLRHANEQVLAVRVRSVDDKLEALKVKHEAEMKAVDAQLNAARAFFEQTKLRTDEIISSADRGRAQRTWFFGVVAVLLSAAAAFGLKEVGDLKKYANQAEEAKQKIDRVRDDIEKMVPDIERFRSAGELLETILQTQYQPAFREALLHGTPEKILNSYSSLVQIQTNIKWFLNDIEIAIRAKPERDYLDVLLAILRDSQNRKERIQAYYLILTNAILVDNADVFKQQLENFKMYLTKDGPIKSEDKLNALKELFETQKPESQRRFRQVEQLIPTR